MDVEINNKNVLKCLNSTFRDDPNAIQALINNKIPCRVSLADNPYIICEDLYKDYSGFRVGPLGIINGVLKSLGLELVCAEYGENGIMTRFRHSPSGVEQAAIDLYDELMEKLCKPGEVTVSHDNVDTIYINEHIRGFTKSKRLKEYKGYKVIQKYVGRIKPAI